MIKNVYLSPCKAPAVLSDINKTWIFWTDFRKILKHQISWKSVHWERSCPCWRTDRYNEGSCALLGYYAASVGNSLPTFRDNLSVPSSTVKIHEESSRSRTDMTKLIDAFRNFSNALKNEKSVAATNSSSNSSNLVVIILLLKSLRTGKCPYTLRCIQIN
jgi:hypothetical protein